jgi:hypothetical protein
VKLILSRKGFDSSAGGAPSPILPDGALCSLPIPEADPPPAARRYSDIPFGGESLGALVAGLTRGRVGPQRAAHLDPDLRADAAPRPPGWRPVFGQSHAAERHLQNHGVGPGDLFLFYGWFRAVEREAGRWRYVAGAPDLHVLFGWLQVDRRVPAVDWQRCAPWAADHPHCRCPGPSDRDSLYLARADLRLPGQAPGAAGAGVFPRFAAALRLSAPGGRRSLWRLPPWFAPGAGGSALSYHARPARWQAQGDHTLLQTVGRGQEFVLDCDRYPAAIPWAAALIRAHGMAAGTP